ncbi:MAG: acyl carrier protein [Saccharofermentanales bacterium]
MNQILELLTKIRPDCNFVASDNFINDYLLDSFDVMALTSELENRFHISINTCDIIPDNYKNVKSIIALIRIKGGELSDDE